MEMDKDIVAGENNKCVFYVNSWTKGVEQWAKEWGLKNIRCMVAEQKDTKEREYIVIEGNDVIFAHKQYESIACHIDIIAVNRGLKRKDSW